MGSTDVPAAVKLWVYSIQGILYELCFTAMFNYFLISPDIRLMGESSIWSIWIYGMGGLLNEYAIYNNIKKKPKVLRILANLIYTYVWEYSNGVVLRAFGACPWDYTERRWNVHGLITFEYVPAWIFAGLLHEEMIKLLQSICWCDKKICANGKVEKRD